MFFFKSLKTYFTFDEISCSDYPTLRVNDSPSSTDPPGRNTPTPQAARSSDIGVHVMGLCKSVGPKHRGNKTYGCPKSLKSEGCLQMFGEFELQKSRTGPTGYKANKMCWWFPVFRLQALRTFSRADQWWEMEVLVVTRFSVQPSQSHHFNDDKSAKLLTVPFSDSVFCDIPTISLLWRSCNSPINWCLVFAIWKPRITEDLPTNHVWWSEGILISFQHFPRSTHLEVKHASEERLEEELQRVSSPASSSYGRYWRLDAPWSIKNGVFLK